jgi:hypothetical protein
MSDDDLKDLMFGRFAQPRKDWTTPSDKHSHDIPVWAVEEVCYFCQYPASHKVEEDTGHLAMITHPMTAYVCCEHFWGWCNNND